MEILITSIFLVFCFCFLIFIVGLIKPDLVMRQESKKKTRIEVLKYYGLIIITLAFSIISLLGFQENGIIGLLVFSIASLFFIFILFFIIGLIKPIIFKQDSRKNIVKVFSILIFINYIILIITSRLW